MTCYEPPALLCASLLSLVALTDGLSSTPTIFQALLRLAWQSAPNVQFHFGIFFKCNFGRLDGGILNSWFVSSVELYSSPLMWLHVGALSWILVAVRTVTHGQDPVICRGTLFSFLAYLPHYCHLCLPMVWKAMQFKSIHKCTHIWTQRSFTPWCHNPLSVTIGRHVGASQCYHVIRCECGSILVLRGHSKDLGAPPPPLSWFPDH